MAENDDTPAPAPAPPRPQGDQETVFAPAPRRAPGEGSLPIGTLLNHIYKVNRFIARGGMAEVYEGENVTTGERVAIKIILGHLKSDEAMQGLFLREARTLTRLNHAALVLYRVLAREPELGVLYIVTEFVDGVPLEKMIGQRPITEAEQRGLLRRLAEGLKTAHDLGAIHRDISPDNIMAPEGRLDLAKIIDFGIAKDLMAEKGTLIGDGFAGKLGFVAPEQFGDFGREVGPWTDVYSLGLVMLAVANGAPVDMGATLVEAMDRRRAGPDLTHVPDSLRPVLGAMLVADPKQRLRSMDDVLAMLGGAPGATAPPPVVAADPTAPPTQPSGEDPAAAREAERVRNLAALHAAEAAFAAARTRESEAAAAAETASATLAQAASQLRGVVDMGAGGTVVQAARHELAGAAETKGQKDSALQAARDAVAAAAEALSAARAACGITDSRIISPQPSATAPPIVQPQPLPQPQPFVQPQAYPQTQPPVGPSSFQPAPRQRGGAGGGLLILGVILLFLIVAGGGAVWWAMQMGKGTPVASGPIPSPTPAGPQAPSTPQSPSTPSGGDVKNPGGEPAGPETPPPAAAPTSGPGANLAGVWAIPEIGCTAPVRIRVDGEQLSMTIGGEPQTAAIISGDADSVRIKDDEGVGQIIRSGDSLTMSDSSGMRLNLTRCPG